MNAHDPFEIHASQWWQVDGPFRTLHAITPARLRFIQDELPGHNLANKKILDVGCGGGILSEALVKGGASVLGIDNNSTLIRIAKEHADANRLAIDYQTCDITQANTFTARHRAQFDAVVCMELLEHLEHPAKCIQSCAALLRLGGVLCVATINRTWHAYMFAIVAGEYLFRVLPPGTHQYERFVRPAELYSWAREAQLTPLRMRGMRYLPYLHKAWLGNNVAINYLASFERLN